MRVREIARRVVPGVLGLAAVLAVYGVIAHYYRHAAMMAPDESFYTLAARLVWDGELPYRDFAYTQTPHLPYLNGALMHLAGFGLDSHRAICAAWGGLGLVLLVLAVRVRLGAWEPALLAGFLMATAPRWVSLQATAVWCGPAGACTAGALLAALWPGPIWRRAVPFALCGTLAIGCRLSCAPVVAVLILPLLLEAGSPRRALAVLGLCLGTGIVLFAPFIAADPGNFWFCVWRFHLDSSIERNIEAQVMQWWNMAPAALLAGIVGLLGAWSLLRGRRFALLALLGAGVVGVVVPMLPESAWGVYIAAGAPLFAAGGIAAIWSHPAAATHPSRHAFWVLPALNLLFLLPAEVGEGAATDPEEIAAYIERHVELGPLLTPAGIVAVEARRDVLPGTELGTFSAMLPGREQEAARRRMTTLAGLARRVRLQEPAAIV
ncbi:MAG TPA: hypothetical protein VM285_14990, partial [Polyangia bacterium]|nr:hypothetical protein [Polyangia bacterium]